MHRFVRYLMAAGLASLADLAIAQSLLFVPVLGSGPGFAVPVVAGALTGMSVNFLLSRRFVFEIDARRARDQMRSFLVIAFTTLGLKLLVGYLLLTGFIVVLDRWFAALPDPAAPARVAQFGAMGIVAIYSFLAHKHISFDGGVRAWLRRRLAP
jgi:putative flippase GtrA